MRHVRLKLFDEDGNELRSESPWSNESIGYSTNTYQFALEKGTYYIQILEYSGYRGKYTISNKHTNIGSNETEENDTIQTADTLSMYKKTTGLLALGETSDMYKVVIPKSGNVPIILKAYMNCVYIKLYNSQGEQLDYNHPYWNESLGYSNNTYTYTLSKGTYYIQILECSGHRGKYQLQVGKKPSVTNATITSIKNKVYTGKSITPSITVKYNGKTLKKNTDYTVSYKNNKNIGTATATVTGKGKYTGTKKVTFKIVPKTVNLTSVRNSSKKTAAIKWKKVANASGYEIYRSTKQSSGYKKVKTITKNKTVSYKNAKLTKGKTYYYKVRAYKKVGNKKYYGRFSNVKAVKIRK